MFKQDEVKQIVESAYHDESRPMFECDNEIRTLTVQKLFTNSIKDMALRESMNGGAILEAPTVSTGNIETFKKLLVPFYARTAAAMIAVDDLVAVTPMSSRTAQVNFMRRIKGANSGIEELLYSTLDSGYGGTGTHALTHDPFVDAGDTDAIGYDSDGNVVNSPDGVDDAFSLGEGFSSVAGEDLGNPSGQAMDKASVRLDQVTMTAKTRKLQTFISDEAYEDAMNEVGLNVIRQTMETAAAELKRSVFSQVYGRLVETAKKELPFDFANIGASDAENFTQKNFLLWAKIEEMRANISRETLEPTLKFKIVASSRVIARLRSISTLDVALTNFKTVVRKLDNNDFYRGTLADYDLYEDPFAEKDYVMVVGKGEGMQAPLIFGNYVPLSVKQAVDYNTGHNVMIFRRRDALITQPFANNTLDGAFTKNANKFARAMRVDNTVILN